MARLFVKANPDKIEYNGTAPITIVGTPVTLAGWCYPDVAGQTMIVCGVGSGATLSGVCRLGLNSANRMFGQRQDNGGTNNVSVSGATATAVNQWQHVAATFSEFFTPHTVNVFYNGVADGTGSGAMLSTTTGRTSIGETPGNLSAGSRAWSGSLAEIGMWEVALGAAEIAALANGVSPLLIRPTALRFYAPLLRDILDVRGGLALTATGTSVSVHPRVFAAAGGP